jgi:hypothetical protein
MSSCWRRMMEWWQGPPGTGKTHTIANIISLVGYGAAGTGDLMKDPALAVLRAVAGRP